MKALNLIAPKKFEIIDVDRPACKPDEVLIRVKAAGICGSDVHGMDGSTGRRIAPIIMGHEASGIIEETGGEVSGLKPGERVTFDSTIYNPADWFSKKGMYNLSDNRRVLGVSCDEYRQAGAFAEYLTVPAHIVYKLPDVVSFEEAAMVEPIAVALHAVSLTPLADAESALVIGAGMIGLSIIQVLRAKGIKTIIALDTSPKRLELAATMGAHYCFDKGDIPAQVQQITNGRGADIAFEAVGISTTIKTAVASVRKGATVTLVGNLAREVELPLQAVVTRQIRLQGSCAICGEYPEALELIARGAVNVKSLISATPPLDEGQAWFDRLYNGDPELLKVIFKI
ncbi:MAG: galactitol-1-phosphate 5-dehydrogenase [Cyclobacteriaceae bacterium]|nr:galactitol-1-phosphate 5-dehydrogenase [Cyclobacteriaceae bacterium]